MANWWEFEPQQYTQPEPQTPPQPAPQASPDPWASMAGSEGLFGWLASWASELPKQPWVQKSPKWIQDAVTHHWWQGPRQLERYKAAYQQPLGREQVSWEDVLAQSQAPLEHAGTPVGQALETMAPWIPGARRGLSATGKAWEVGAQDVPFLKAVEQGLSVPWQAVQEGGVIAKEKAAGALFSPAAQKAGVDVLDYAGLTAVGGSMFKEIIKSDLAEMERGRAGETGPRLPGPTQRAMEDIAAGRKTAEEIGEEIYDPMAEAIAEMILDPLNLIDFVFMVPGVVKFSRMSQAARRLGKVADVEGLAKAAKLERALVSLGDDAKAIQQAGEAAHEAIQKAGVLGRTGERIAETAPAWLKTIGRSAKWMVDLLPQAKAERDLGELWMSVAPFVGAADEDPRVVMALLQQFADAPRALSKIAGNVSISNYGEKAQVILRHSVDDIANLPSLKPHPGEGFNEGKFMSEMNDLLKPMLMKAHGYTGPPPGLAGTMLKFASAMKRVMSEFYLNPLFSPGYIMRQLGSELTVPIIDGINPLSMKAHYEGMLADYGITGQSRRIVTKGVGRKTQLTGIPEVAGETGPRPKSIFRIEESLFGKEPSKYNIPARISERTMQATRTGGISGGIPIGEEARYLRGFAEHLKKFMDTNWRSVNLPPLNPELAARLGDGPGGYPDLMHRLTLERTEEAKRGVVDAFFKAEKPGQVLSPSRHLSDDLLAAMDPEVLKAFDREAAKLPITPSPEDKAEFIAKIQTMIDEGEAKKLADTDRTPPMRKVASEAAEKEIAEIEIGHLREAAEKAAKHGDDSLTGQIDEIAEEYKAAADARVAERQKMVEAAKEMPDHESAMAIVLEANQQLTRMQNETRRFIDELRRWVIGQEQAGNANMSEIWVRYFNDANQKYGALRETRRDVYSVAQERIARLMAGEPLEDVLGVTAKEARRRLVLEMPTVPDAPEEFIAASAKKDDPRFAQQLDYKRSREDYAMQDAWRATFVAEPEKYGDVMDVLQSAENDVALFAKQTVGKVAKAREEAFKLSDKAKAAGKHAEAKQVWEEYWIKRHGLWSSYFDDSVARWEWARDDVMLAGTGEMFPTRQAPAGAMAGQMPDDPEIRRIVSKRQAGEELSEAESQALEDWFPVGETPHEGEPRKPPVAAAEPATEPFTYYRGTVAGEARRIQTGDAEWDSRLFVSDDPSKARLYGAEIEEIKLAPDAKILREGSPEFERLVGQQDPSKSTLEWASAGAKAAESAGYDAIHFSKQGDIGTAILNEAKVIGRRPLEPVTEPFTREAFIGWMRKAGIDEAQIGDEMAVMDAMAKVWAKKAGRSVDDFPQWYDEHIAAAFVGDEAKDALEQALLQSKKGAIRFRDDGKAVLHAFEGADVSTVLHETAHIFRRMLEDQELSTVTHWATGALDGKWTVEAEEKFARGFERYLAEGRAPTPELESVFQRFKEWLTEIYRAIKGSDIDVELTDGVRGVFDRMLAESPEPRGVAPAPLQGRAQQFGEGVAGERWEIARARAAAKEAPVWRAPDWVLDEVRDYIGLRKRPVTFAELQRNFERLRYKPNNEHLELGRALDDLKAAGELRFLDEAEVAGRIERGVYEATDTLGVKTAREIEEAAPIPKAPEVAAPAPKVTPVEEAAEALATAYDPAFPSRSSIGDQLLILRRSKPKGGIGWNWKKHPTENQWFAIIADTPESIAQVGPAKGVTVAKDQAIAEEFARLSFDKPPMAWDEPAALLEEAIDNVVTGRYGKLERPEYLAGLDIAAQKLQSFKMPAHRLLKEATLGKQGFVDSAIIKDLVELAQDAASKGNLTRDQYEQVVNFLIEGKPGLPILQPGEGVITSATRTRQVTIDAVKDMLKEVGKTEPRARMPKDVEPTRRGLTKGQKPLWQEAPDEHTPEFKEWFGDSKAVDENGKPLPVYHGTQSPLDFDEFSTYGPPIDQEGYEVVSSSLDPSSYMGAHFAEEPEVASQFAGGPGRRPAWLGARREQEAGRIYPAHLSVQNPKVFEAEGDLRDFYMRLDMEHSREVDVYAQMYRGGDEAFWEQYVSSQEFRHAVNDELLTDAVTMDVEYASTFAKELGEQARSELRAMGHDGVKYKNQVEGGTSWIAFEPEQAKTIWNPKPTEDPRLLHQITPEARKAQIEQMNEPGHVTRPLMQELIESNAQKNKRGVDEMAEGLFKDWTDPKLKPQIQTQQTEDAVWDWFNSQYLPKWKETKATAVSYAKTMTDYALLDYNNFRGIDMMLSFMIPYHFWYTRSGWNWMQRFMTRPGMAAQWIRSREAMKLANENAGRRQRFGHMIKVPFPWMPEWMGDALYVDPISYFMPFDNIFNIGWDDNEEARHGLSKIHGTMERLGMRMYPIYEFPYQSGVWQEMGERLGMEPEKAEKYLGPETPDEFGTLLPMTGSVKAISALAREKGIGEDVIPPGGLALENMPRALVGLPRGDAWDPYRVGRMLGNMAAENQTDQDAAILALIGQELILRDKDQRGEVWREGAPIAQKLMQEYGFTPELMARAQAMLAEAMQKATFETGVRTAGYYAGPRLAIEPRGERAQLEMADEARGQVWSPETGEGGYQQYRDYKMDNPAMYPRATQYDLLPGGQDEFESMSPAARANWLMQQGAKEGVHTQVDQGVDEFLRQRPWDSKGAAAIEAQRGEGLAGVEEKYPLPPYEGEMPDVLYGMSPEEAAESSVERALGPYRDTMPQASTFTEAGEINWDEYNKERDAWEETIPDTLPGVGKYPGGKYEGLSGKESMDMWMRQYDSPMEAAMNVYKDDVSGPAWDQYHATKDANEEAWDDTVGQVGAMPATALVDQIMAEYPEKGWDREELLRELEGVTFPPLGEQGTKEQQEERQQVDAFWSLLKQVPGKAAVKDNDYVQLMLNKQGRGVATPEQIDQATAALQAWLDKNPGAAQAVRENQQMWAQIEKRWPQGSDLEGQYFDLPAGDRRRAFLDAFPQLKEMWTFKDEFKGSHPVYVQYYDPGWAPYEQRYGGSTGTGAGTGGYISMPWWARKDYSPRKSDPDFDAIFAAKTNRFPRWRPPKIEYGGPQWQR